MHVYEDEAAHEFDLLFEQQKANGHTDGEAARHVFRDVNAEKERLMRMERNGEIDTGEYIERAVVLSLIGVRACQIWDAERNTATAVNA
jgi:regulator of sigma D